MRTFIALALLVACGVAHGVMTDRWGKSRALEDAVAALDGVPMDFGDWEGMDVDMQQRHIREGGIEGYLARRYVDRSTGEVVSMALVCGRTGPISGHTPDLCYVAAGYEFVGEPARLAAPPPGGAAGTPEVWVATVTKRKTATGRHLRICWSWSAGGAWKAPDHPRLAFAASPTLYKLYVVQELASPEEPVGDGDASLRFLAEFAAYLQEFI